MKLIHSRLYTGYPGRFRTRVTMQDFAQAHENRTKRSDEANWFKMDWPKFSERFGSVQTKV